jgi:hypothetical protein
MAPRTLAGLSAQLCAAGSTAEALAALSQEVAEADRAGTVALYECDPHRALLCACISIRDGAPTATPIEVALDYLPAPVRQTLLAGKQFAELGTQTDDYMKLLRFPAVPEGGAFLLRGCGIDGELLSVLALYEPKRVFGGRLSERIGAATDLFVLAVNRLREREARLEAAARLEQLTKILHDEHSRVISDLERQLQQARAAASGDESEMEKRIGDLQRAAELARLEARTTARRLSAVEEQVTSAAGRLEKAHRQLHDQSEAMRHQRNLLYRIERMLRDAAGSESSQLVEELLAVVSPTSAPLDTQ